ncbi:hypothetical protein RD110_08090 [Rhodoferax koreense]|uniref:Uncharacterized protein n=1 Tax=Rhodoferax koreensis TaxID=1842727 RepID=A0A1P8JTT9_9BURK|nr:hypothetical protein [Rhodoferax koreense]APW37163.1 hypothetical protein RD110_08090 [Rhodoferax koreense]
MPAITYNEFSGGLDRRLSINSQDANKLWSLRNAYVTLGKRLNKRPGLRKVTAGLAGSFGLESVSGALKVFCDAPSGFAPPVVAGLPIDRVSLNVPPAGSTLDRIYYADLFQGFIYVVARYASGYTRHHYVDGATTYISDANCPHTIGVTKAASRIFAPSAENVRYSAAGAARDWTTASDAGFLPAGLQQDTKGLVKACGTFQDSLVVFFDDSAQIWAVATDPAANAISKRLYGIGTQAPLSLASFFSDLVFLSPFGFRSMTVQAVSNRIDDSDVGVPIDPLVKPDIATVAATADPEEIMGVWIAEFGQYWAVMDMGSYSKVWVYTFSRSSKIACWSEYIYPIEIKAIATLAGKVYLRSVDALYEADPLKFTDDGQLIDIEVQMAFQDAKSPGVSKQFYGADFVTEGTPSVSYKFDPRDTGKESIPMVIPGDTRPGDILPVEIMAPALAPVFRHSKDEAMTIDALTLFYNTLGLNG